ncbi:hypothetical protein [Lachnoclostridium phytofermentans]|uniref:DUF8091 domain-containing protein n=1 Tax=Lachnoclostridium phytofermentans (strain ATCC 700394 / DSM 18823 / ISDg) TaxID=357809 RepID=A9KQA5_LACP7|nr:hypothetical protein [Lachnoclostridium phytofermentans]ABX40414.1 hypothetical protein Cphy_0023 [Lachnoclostridium phytofermentans ISDg]
MNQELFQISCSQVIDQALQENGIGTLSEKTIHSVLKHYYSPDTACHEQKVKNFVADILIENHIIEIQTRQFHKLRRKLEVYLPEYEVTIVYPVAHTKWLSWVNEETGEVSKPRKSPKTGVAYQIFPELYQIKDYLKDPNLHLNIISMDVEEYRLLNGWSKDKKKGSTRNDGIPVALFDEMVIVTKDDYNKLLPANLPKQFTTKDYKKAAGVPQRIATTALNILYHMNTIDRVGKQGNSFLYEVI